jgi:hypothetical protein
MAIRLEIRNKDSDAHETSGNRQNWANLSTGCRLVMDKDDVAAKSTKVATQ